MMRILFRPARFRRAALAWFWACVALSAVVRSAAAQPHTPPPRATQAPASAAVTGAAAPGGGAAQAEDAYARIDFEETRSAALAALAAGGLDASAAARLYFLLGVAQAALGEEDQARDAFLRMLALDPERTVDRALSPRLRAPYLEARGLFDSRGERLSVTAESIAASDLVVLRARDPVGFATTIRVSMRRTSTDAWTVRELPFARESRTPAPRGTGTLQLAVALVDSHGNLLVAAGSEADPLVLGAPLVAGAETRPRAPGRGNGHIVVAGFAIGVGVLGLGAGTAGVLLRADAAGDFNDDALCFQPRTPALTRGEQCSGELDAARNGEILAAIGFGVAGAAAVVTFIALLVGGDGDEPNGERALACGAGPGTLGFACEGRF